MNAVRKSYASSRHGQIHLRTYFPETDESARALLCLHPSPYSGLFFETIAPSLAAGRRVIAPDYPGYGASDAPPDKPTIGIYADAMADAISEVCAQHGPLDLLGFHTGCLVAVEMSLANAPLVRRLVLVDVPYFNAEQRPGLHAMTTPSPGFNAEVACLEKTWARNVGDRIGVVPLDRSLAMLAEELRLGSRANWGFHAAFTYPCEERFAAVGHPACVIATDSGLLEPSRIAAAAIPACRLTRLPDVHAPAMETGGEAIAAATLEFLDND